MPFELMAERGSLWIQMNGTTHPLHIKGANWAGFQASGCVPELWRHNLQSYIDFLVEHRFNAVRLPLSAPIIAANAATGGLCGEYAGMRTLDILEDVARRLKRVGILVVLDIHTLSDPEQNDPLWCLAASCSTVTEAPLWRAWEVLAARFCSHPNVIAADLFNEPYGATCARHGTRSRNTLPIHITLTRLR